MSGNTIWNVTEIWRVWNCTNICRMVKCIDMHLSNVLTIICQPKWRNSLTLRQEALLKFNKAAIANRGLLKNINRCHATVYI